ncbi:MAG: nucleoside kinase [Oscillospiraceae bacterium]|nr:nucleoside kinase [Oscillospiraceae bacterium]
MEYGIRDILFRLDRDPRAYADDCEERYEDQITLAARRIYHSLDKRPIVLLTGPSGSGKTTTAIKLVDALKKQGVGSVCISMDGYFKDYEPETAPRTPDGSRDMESPLCLDLEYMAQQFKELSQGKEVIIPTYDFALERRSREKGTPLRLGEGEVAIFEGIHALNEMVTDISGVDTFKLYVSVNSDIVDDSGDVVYAPRTARLLRRMIRDSNYRAAPPEYTLELWPNVIRGEDLYISPKRGKADMEIDTFMPYEPSVMRTFVLPVIRDIPELQDICRLLSVFPEIDNGMIQSDSLLREFIGGGIYNY